MQCQGTWKDPASRSRYPGIRFKGRRKKTNKRNPKNQSKCDDGRENRTMVDCLPWAHSPSLLEQSKVNPFSPIPGSVQAGHPGLSERDFLAMPLHADSNSKLLMLRSSFARPHVRASKMYAKCAPDNCSMTLTEPSRPSHISSRQVLGILLPNPAILFVYINE